MGTDSAEVHHNAEYARGVIFGYRHVQGVSLCPCGDPGNYMMLEQPSDDPLDLRFRCWCGSTMRVTFEELSERDGFIAGLDEAQTPTHSDGGQA